MIRKLNYWLLISLIIGAMISRPIVATADSLNLLLDAQNVTYRREGENQYAPGMMGESYRDSDYLKVSPQGTAIILCRNGAKWQVPNDNQPYQIGDYCPASSSDQIQERPWWQLVRDGLFGTLPNSLTNPRGNEAISHLPYIITPRNTMILSDRPTIIWNLVPSSATYTVQLLGDNLLWVVETDTNSLPYPTEESSLTPELDYYLTVTTDKNLSSTEENTIRIQVLNTPEKEALQTALNDLKQENLSPQAREILQASLYSHFGLYAQMITTLESYLNKYEKSALAYQLF